MNLPGRKTQTLASSKKYFLLLRNFKTVPGKKGKIFHTVNCLQLCTKHDYNSLFLQPVSQCTGNHKKQRYLFIHTLHTLCGEATRRKRRKITSFIHTCCILKQIANLLSQTKHKTNLKTVCLKTPK